MKQKEGNKNFQIFDLDPEKYVVDKNCETYIMSHPDYIPDWKEVSKKQLSPEFIDKFADKLNWTKLCIHCKLTEDTIEKHIDKVNWLALEMHQVVSQAFAEKYNMNERVVNARYGG